MTNEAETAPDRRTALIQVLVLVGLAHVLYWRELMHMFTHALRDLEAAQFFAGPLLAVVLVVLRRRTLARSVGRGSFWGLVLILGALGIYTLSSWPFNYGYPRWISLVPLIGGIVLAVCGWRTFWHLLPVLFLMLLTIPVGSRYYARLIIKPETVTLDLAATALDLMPGAMVDVEGSDLTYIRGAEEGSIALGEPHRGASLFLAYLTITVFATFARVRPWWQVVVMAVAAGPIALFCSFVRLFIWGVVTMYVTPHPISAAPRFTAVAVSLVLAYGLTAILLAILTRIVPEDDDDAEARAGSVATAGGRT